MSKLFYSKREIREFFNFLSDELSSNGNALNPNLREIATLIPDVTPDINLANLDEKLRLLIKLIESKENANAKDPAISKLNTAASMLHRKLVQIKLIRFLTGNLPIYEALDGSAQEEENGLTSTLSSLIDALTNDALDEQQLKTEIQNLPPHIKEPAVAILVGIDSDLDAWNQLNSYYQAKKHGWEYFCTEIITKNLHNEYFYDIAPKNLFQILVHSIKRDYSAFALFCQSKGSEKLLTVELLTELIEQYFFDPKYFGNSSTKQKQAMIDNLLKNTIYKIELKTTNFSKFRAFIFNESGFEVKTKLNTPVSHVNNNSNNNNSVPTQTIQPRSGTFTNLSYSGIPQALEVSQSSLANTTDDDSSSFVKNFLDQRQIRPQAWEEPVTRVLIMDDYSATVKFGNQVVLQAALNNSYKAAQEILKRKNLYGQLEPLKEGLAKILCKYSEQIQELGQPNVVQYINQDLLEDSNIELKHLYEDPQSRKIIDKNDYIKTLCISIAGNHSHPPIVNNQQRPAPFSMHQPSPMVALSKQNDNSQENFTFRTTVDRRVKWQTTTYMLDSYHIRKTDWDNPLSRAQIIVSLSPQINFGDEIEKTASEGYEAAATILRSQRLAKEFTSKQLGNLISGLARSMKLNVEQVFGNSMYSSESKRREILHELTEQFNSLLKNTCCKNFSLLCRDNPAILDFPIIKQCYDNMLDEQNSADYSLPESNFNF